jgi:proteasome accessory factor A
MRRILAGIETEYGFSIPGRGPADQVEDSAALVGSYPGSCFSGWDGRFESPRADLRGFVLEKLAEDPIDRQFDRGGPMRRVDEVRADRVLTNGARFYNDHGHPEYATPECWSLSSLVAHDRAGEAVVLRAADAFAREHGVRVALYKNNTDYHGASYGTHENYLVPRNLGVAALIDALMPLLVVRPLLCGAGKVGSEFGEPVDFQCSQRADFFAEGVNAETLYRRPIFNTRDEPHADPGDWIRLHVICGDANRIEGCTKRKVGLVKIALLLAQASEFPRWSLGDPVRAAQAVSRSLNLDCRIDLVDSSWTTPRAVFESYLDCAEKHLDLDEELQDVSRDCRRLLECFDKDFQAFSRSVDWAAKYKLLLEYRAAEQLDWQDPTMQAIDLEYHKLDPDNGLFEAMVENGKIEPQSAIDVDVLLDAPENTRAAARGYAVRRFGNQLAGCCWRSLSFNLDGNVVQVELEPDRMYDLEQSQHQDVLEWIRSIAPCK